MTIDRTSFIMDLSARVPKALAASSPVLRRKVPVPMIFGNITPLLNVGGTEVSVPIVRRKTARNITVGHQRVQAQDTSEDSITLPIQNWREVSFALRDDQMVGDVNSAAGVLMDQLEASQGGLAETIQTTCLGLHSKIGNSVGWVTGTPANDTRLFVGDDGLSRLFTLKAKIDRNDVGAGATYFLICGEATKRDLLTLPGIIQVDRSMMPEVLKDADLFKVGGFYVYSTTSVDALTVSGHDPRESTSTPVYAHTAVAVPTDGRRTSDITFTNIDDDGLQVGDRFFFDNTGSTAPTHGNDTQTYVITAVQSVDTANHRQTATVSPAIRKEVTITPAGTRSHFQFATADYQTVLAFAIPASNSELGSLVFGTRNLNPMSGNGLVGGTAGMNSRGEGIWNYTDEMSQISFYLEAERQSNQLAYFLRCSWVADAVRTEWACIGIEPPSEL